MSRRHRHIPVYRDGKIHVLKRQCATCIFWPDERAAVETERAAGMLAECIQTDTIVPCHEWMDTKTPVVCRGLFNQRKVAVLQIAERLGAVVFDDLGDGPGFEK
jgi:hypothetical protein